MYIEIFGAGDVSLWLDISTDPELCGILVDLGPLYGGWFFELADIISFIL